MKPPKKINPIPNNVSPGARRKSRVVSRREFLKEGTTGVLSVATIMAVGDMVWAASPSAGTEVPLAKGAVLADKSLCSGCRTCEVVCSNVNSQGRNSSALALVILDKDYIAGAYQPRACFQCLDPPCLPVCPVDALQIDKKSGYNIRFIDTTLCIGCLQCLDACDTYFAAARPRFDPQNDVCIKCHLCWGDPNCVKYCPTGALRFEKSEKGLRIGYPIIQGV